MDKARYLRKVEAKVKKRFGKEGSGHDWWHIERVRRAAIHIDHREGADVFLVEAAALLHDVGDYKLEAAKAGTQAEQVRRFVSWLGEDEVAAKIAQIVDKVSFSKNFRKDPRLSLEAQVVQDADRLDAIGAIGIARTFAYGGSKGRVIYDPDFPARKNMSGAQRRKRAGPGINHFYEKLLLLRSLLNTKTARRIAARRHRFMQAYLREFFREAGEFRRRR